MNAGADALLPAEAPARCAGPRVHGGRRGRAAHVTMASVTTPCQVWWAAPVSPEDAPHLLPLLDDHEQERLGRFRRPVDTARYLAAHALTRLVLADRLGRPAGTIEFDRTCRCGQQHGKPVLTDGGPHFSFTHAGDLIGLAVHADAPVGLDVEQVRMLNDLPSMARHVCSPAELRTPPDAPGAFFRTWTRKEALLKATGEGLSSPMNAITLGAGGVESWTGEGAPAGPIWLRDLRPAPDHPAAVAGFGQRAPEVVESDGNAVIAAAAT